ncbi:hypothetical protein SDC9_167588 [bioreactor metagenome]|uniref:Uncharacterized protein n=1 Tax=bioreactor metagenome TaxID=1076179 RepID=A0A645G2T3_9ZZZZ
MAGEAFGSILEIDVVGIADFAQVRRPVAFGVVEVTLESERVRRGYVALPAPEQVATGYFLACSGQHVVGWAE